MPWPTLYVVGCANENVHILMHHTDAIMNNKMKWFSTKCS